MPFTTDRKSKIELSFCCELTLTCICPAWCPSYLRPIHFALLAAV
jgi:hypothetical protein